MRLLVTADTHIGCRSSQLSPEIAACYRPAVMLQERIVNAASAYGVDAVLLAGDVVDQHNKYFEALGVLEQTIEKLAAANIVTLAVAGNHDYDVLSRLAEAGNMNKFKLLGAHGTWEAFVLTGGDGMRVQICGWSFPREHVNVSPVQQFSLRKEDGVSTVIGLLHGDLDQCESEYAPVRSQELAQTGIPYWVLGHVHKPYQQHIDGVSILCPGSSQGLDPGPGERGIHGPWLLDVSAAGVTVGQIPLAPVRYEVAHIPLNNVSSAPQLQEQVSVQLRKFVKQWKNETPDLASVSVRVHLTGTTTLPHVATKNVLAEISEAGTFLLEGVEIFLNGVNNDASPPIDLESLKQNQGPPQALAQLLEALQADKPLPPEVEGLVTDAQKRLRSDVYQSSTFLQLHDAGDAIDISRNEVIARLQEQARALLMELWQQQQHNGVAER